MTVSRWLLLALWMLAWQGCGAGEAAPRVEANGERLVGSWEGENGRIAAFRGIPFAQPPVGRLRWRQPQPALPRSGEQAARTFAPACMQGTHITDWYAGVARDLGADPAGVGRFNGVSEDCLYLNVWSPDLSGQKLPVVIWVHGGSNAGGWSYEPNYYGERLAARGVVVVTVAYRLGPFGFFSHPALDNGPGEPVANFGWLDMIFALKWVHKHVSAFGGDPDNITVMGESSGAANIADFIAQDIAGEALFRRAVLQSAPLELARRRTLAEERAAGRKIAAAAGVAAGKATAERLRAIPAEKLARAAQKELPGHYYDVVYDGRTFLRPPVEVYDTAAVGRLDLLIGTNAHEWLMYIDRDTGWPEVEAWIRDNAPGKATVLHSVVEHRPDPRRALDRLRTARSMRCPAAYVAERISAAGGRAWVYHFSRVRPGPAAGKIGAYHGTEIAYVFDQHEYWQPTGEWDRQLTDMVMDYWVRFAQTGDPNVPRWPRWPRYRAAAPQVMEIGNAVRAVPQPDADLCLWLGPKQVGRP